MYNWKNARNYRHFRDENGNVIANIIYVDGEEVAVSDEVYEAYLPMTTLLSSILKRNIARWSKAWAARSLKSRRRHPIISMLLIWSPATTTAITPSC